MKEKTKSEDWAKQALKIFSNKIEKELKEKSCGCNGCTCEESMIKGATIRGGDDMFWPEPVKFIYKTAPVVLNWDVNHFNNVPIIKP